MTRIASSYCLQDVNTIHAQMTANSLLPYLHLRPLTPNLCEVFDSSKVNFSRLLQNFPSIIEIDFGLSRRTSLLVEVGKVDVQTVEVGRCFARVDG